jgi:hypothetical protein
METTVETKEVTGEKVATEFPAGDIVVTIKVHDSRFEPLAWVARAVDMPGSGRVTDYLYSTGEEIVATNGKRMHCFSPAPLPAGYWRPIKRTKGELQLRKETDDREYPPYNKLIPDITGDHETIETSLSIDVMFARLIRAMVPVMKGSVLETYTINHEYLEDIIQDQETFTVHLNDPGKVLYFVAADRWALVMPMNIK